MLVGGARSIPNLQTPGAVSLPATGTNSGSTANPGPTQGSSTAALSWIASGGAAYYELGVTDLVAGSGMGPRNNLWIPLLLISLSALGCAVDEAPPLRRMAAIAGDGLTGTAGFPLATSPTVRVWDGVAHGVSGVAVSFVVDSGGGALQRASTTITDAEGFASAGSWTIGAVGFNSVTATSEGVAGSPIHFSATGVGPPFRFMTLSGRSSGFCGLSPLHTSYCMDGPRPVVVGGGITFTQLSSGGGTCGVSQPVADGGAGGAVYCWGSNRFGQLGDGTTYDRPEPGLVKSGLVFQSVSVGESHACALTLIGAAYCWGSNASGQLGDGTTTDRLAPTPVIGGLTFMALAAAGDQGPNGHTCALTTASVPYCWGNNSAGQLGDGTTIRRLHPSPVAGGLSFTSIFARNHHTCGIAAERAYCWGANNQGQLGDGTLDNRLSPTPVRGGIRFQSVAPGVDHTCGVTTSTTVYCWGDNYYGQLGSPLASALEPRQLEGPSFRTIASTFGSSCGIATDGQTYCWGKAFPGVKGALILVHRP